MKKNRRSAQGLLLWCLPISMLTYAAAGVEYSPPVANPYPAQVFWGDTHLHTNQSPDAFSLGNHVITPELAYRFARGEVVVAQSGVKAKLDRPLDFLMVSDHSEFMGVFPKVFSRSPDIIDTPLGKRWGAYVAAGTPEQVGLEFALVVMGAGRGNAAPPTPLSASVTPEFLAGLAEVKVPESVQKSVWQQVGAVADKYNEPGFFTAFIGYEWTSMPDGNNLHRNVLFRDDSSYTAQVVPFSSLNSGNPEDLWQFMADYESVTGGSVLAIPHNGNVSNGLMFAETTLDGKPLTLDYVQRRQRWEPLVEVTQIKGDGEAHPFLSPNDEFADYETWDKANLSMTIPKQNSMLQFEYARAALKNGLALEQSLGVNPFQFGMIGSTDSHTGLATADENNFFGKMLAGEPAPDRAERDYFPVQVNSAIALKQWASAASGYAAIWATENTRAALFEAMRRKETYATTGPRMVVRFFGGWSFSPEDIQRPDYAQYGYHQGVPMGGQLPASGASAGPRFMVSALKDPLGANLDRIQIIKGWVDKDGVSHEQVYNVAASDGRQIVDNQVSTVGNTVDVAAATYRNSIGDAELAQVWQDPDFNPRQRAFYYARVLEIPTPRWTTIDSEEFGTKLLNQIPAYGQERAYTSPIWYSPATAALARE